jgi:hypothetical protein
VRKRITPFFALFLSFVAVLGLVLWLYDRYSYRRMLRRIHQLGHFAQQYS